MEIAISEIPRLRSLTCDYTSLDEGLSSLLVAFKASVNPPICVDVGYGVLVSQLQALELPLSHSNEHQIASLLRRAPNLRELTLKGKEHIITKDHVLMAPLGQCSPTHTWLLRGTPSRHPQISTIRQPLSLDP